MTDFSPPGSYTPPPPPPPPGGGGHAPQGGGYVPPGGGYVPPSVPPPIAANEQLRVFFIVSLVVNGIAALIWLLSIIGLGAATCGLGCLFIFIPAIPVVALVLDAMAISKLGLPPSPANHSFLKTAAIVDIVAGAISLGIVPLAMGILALLHLQKPEVQRAYGVPAPPTGF